MWKLPCWRCSATRRPPAETRGPAAALLAARIQARATRGPASVDSAREHEGALWTPALLDPLSEREVEVLRMLDSDLTGPESVRHVHVLVNTFRTHTKRIFTKLGVRNRAAPVRRGRSLGLL